MPASTERFQKATIIFRKDHTEDLWSIRVRPEHPITFKPGQYATLGIEEEGKVVERLVLHLLEPARGGGGVFL